jgi:hypothetical protein
MRAAAFSADGSVLAVAADTVITLWDPDKNELIAVVGEAPSVRFFWTSNHVYLCVFSARGFLHMKMFQMWSISTNKTCQLLTQMLVKVHALLLVWLLISVWNFHEDYGYYWRQQILHLLSLYLAACIKASNTGL